MKHAIHSAKARAKAIETNEWLKYAALSGMLISFSTLLLLLTM